MSKRCLQALFVTLTFVVGLTIDQWTKVWVKTHMALHESLRVTDWFHITFIENNGMAFGLEFFDKYLLTGFRIVATAVVAVYICRLLRRGVAWGYLACMALIMTGAAGNIIDCVFYGQIFDSPAPPAVAQLVPFGQGYGEWFRGRVVDMFYFPFFEWTWPDWMPFVGGTRGLFFSYIFNVADACISVAVIALIIFYRRTLTIELGEKPASLPTPDDSPTASECSAQDATQQETSVPEGSSTTPQL